MDRQWLRGVDRRQAIRFCQRPAVDEAVMMSHSDVAGFGYAVGSNGQAYWVAVYGNNDGGN